MTKRFVISAATFVAACFSGQMAWAQAQVIEAGSQNSRSTSVVQPVASLTTEQRLQRLERMFEARSGVQLELQSGLAALQQELSELRGSLESQAYQLQQITERQRELYLELDRRLASLPSQPAAEPAAKVAKPEGYSSDLSENQAYDQAVKLVLEDKNYEAAVPAFEAFLARYPTSTYAANASYWLGQLLYNQGNTAGAEQAFVKVVKEFPGSNKRADSLLKLGLIAAQQGQGQQAKTYLQQVVDEYPQSASAKLAKNKLAEL